MNWIALSGCIVAVLAFFGGATAQETSRIDTTAIPETPISLGRVDDAAIKRSAPVYPKTLKQPKHPGLIMVRIQLDLREGKVTQAKAIIGYPTFRKYAEEAAFQTRFEPKKIEGPPLLADAILNFYYRARRTMTKASVPPKGLPVIVTGTLNGRAVDLPKPLLPRNSGNGRTNVRIVVDMAGRVIDAAPVEGPPHLLSASVSAARLARFSPFNYCCGAPIYVVGYLEYWFRGDEKGQ